MSTRSLVLIALFTAIIVVLGLVPPIMLGFFPVPILVQSLGVILAGIVLGARGGAFSVLLLLTLVAIGLPVLSGGRGGLAVFVGPTAGYLIGFLPQAFVSGWIADKVVAKNVTGWKLYAGLFFGGVVGVLINHALGITWLANFVGLSLADAVIGNMIFVPGDLAKAAIAAYVGHLVSKNLGTRARG
ncbi:biotin transport system substrate-specific component [Neorhizobium huautlense]|uniref:Biotin transporter n=1 Tax=Neorhizobium huautlense TaxID=67774 RepID=A0ABT9PTQ7_9HYPH|nr:biotin transporter BioY [Neorhizobium huautlense]MDP9837274.1 biotin transport system substrate-specific component [Neorhizobium huautlense]